MADTISIVARTMRAFIARRVWVWDLPLVDHRSRRRASTALERGRYGLDCLQRRDLQFRGAQQAVSVVRPLLQTRSDTETIVHLYEELGEAYFAELRGIFARAVGRERKKLVLARDRIGKPLYYSWDGRDCIRLGSNDVAGRRDLAEMDTEALSDYFSYQYIPAPRQSIATFENSGPRIIW